MSAIADYVAERSPTSAAPQSLSEESWSPATRIAFRFCVVYFGLYVLTTQMLAGMMPNPKFRVPVLAEKLPMRPLVLWVGNHLLGVQPSVQCPCIVRATWKNGHYTLRALRRWRNADAIGTRCPVQRYV